MGQSLQATYDSQLVSFEFAIEALVASLDEDSKILLTGLAKHIMPKYVNNEIKYMTVTYDFEGLFIPKYQKVLKRIIPYKNEIFLYAFREHLRLYLTMHPIDQENIFGLTLEYVKWFKVELCKRDES
jgi:hypothetical protein